MTKQLLWIGTAVMTTLLALFLVWQFRVVVVYVVLSLALAAALRPLIQRPAGQPLAARLAIILLYLVVLAGFVFLLVGGVGAAIRDIQQLAQEVSEPGAGPDVGPQGGSVQQWLETWLPPPRELFAALIGDQGEVVLPAVVSLTSGILSLLSGVLVIFFLSIYWSIDQNHFERLWLSLLPSGRRRRARDIWEAVESGLGTYIRSQAAQTFLVGLLLGVGYWLLGSPYPALLALIGALVLLIPIVGPLLAVIPPLLLGLFGGVLLSVLTAVYTLIVALALKRWIESRLAHDTPVNPMLTIVLLLALADAYGLFAILFAPPLSAAIQIMWTHLVSARAVSGAALQVSDLKKRQEQVWDTIRMMDEPPPLVASSMERLTALIEKAEPVLNPSQTVDS